MAEKTQRIGIFDSGLGGTTVLKEMIKSLPNEDYIYIMEIMEIFLMVLEKLKMNFKN